VAASCQSAIRFIVALGTISLFAGVTYEGARSVNGPFLGSLGASAAIVGIVSGAGEFVGYLLRLFPVSPWIVRAPSLTRAFGDDQRAGRAPVSGQRHARHGQQVDEVTLSELPPAM
jgi:hypothetical protein